MIPSLGIFRPLFMKCIYCFKTYKEVSFNDREHVIPEFLGTFGDSTPVLHDIVCSECNKLFSKLESNFKTGTLEGWYSDHILSKNVGSKRIDHKRLKIDIDLPDYLPDILKGIIPFSNFFDGNPRLNVRPLAMLILEDWQIRFSLDSLEKIRKSKSKKYFKRLQILKEYAANKGTLMVVYSDEWDPVRTDQLLKEYKVEYKYDDYIELGSSKGDQTFGMKISGELDEDMRRVICKIGFNFFSYCAIQDRLEDLSYHTNFKRFREFIRNGSTKIDFLMREGVNLENEFRNPQLKSHLLIFYRNSSDEIVIIISLFRFFVYRMVIGYCPDHVLESKSPGLGNIVVADPIKNEFYNYSKGGELLTTDHKFSLFNFY